MPRGVVKGLWDEERVFIMGCKDGLGIRGWWKRMMGLLG